MNLEQDITISIEPNTLRDIQSIKNKANTADLGKLAMKDSITPEDTGSSPPEGSYWCHDGTWTTPIAGMSEVICLETPTITLTGTGSEEKPVQANVRLSEHDRNAISLKDDGIHVQIPDIEYPPPEFPVMDSYSGPLKKGEIKILRFGLFYLNIQANTWNDLFLVSLYHPGLFHTSAYQMWNGGAITPYNRSGHGGETYKYAENIGYGDQDSSYFHANIWDINNNDMYCADIFFLKPTSMINAKIRET